MTHAGTFQTAGCSGPRVSSQTRELHPIYTAIQAFFPRSIPLGWRAAGTPTPVGKGVTLKG
jgi:hypothetical protein